MPDHLIVIRSGATDYDLQGRIRGTLGIPLAAEGAAAASRAGLKLAEAPPAAIYASEDESAEETARIIGVACDRKPKSISGLGNIDMGLWQGRLIDEIRDTQPRLHRQWQDHPWSVEPPEGELLDDVCGRVEEVLEKLFLRHPSGIIAVVVPRPLDAVVAWLVSGRPMGDLWDFERTLDLAETIPVAAQWHSPPPRIDVLASGRTPTAPHQPFLSR